MLGRLAEELLIAIIKPAWIYITCQKIRFEVMAPRNQRFFKTLQVSVFFVKMLEMHIYIH